MAITARWIGGRPDFSRGVWEDGWWVGNGFSGLREVGSKGCRVDEVSYVYY